MLTTRRRLLSVTLDAALSFDKHVTNVVRTCTYHTRALRHIRPFLTIEAAKSAAASFIGTRLDYCNYLLFGSTERNLDRLQRVQNNLVRRPVGSTVGERHRLTLAPRKTTNYLQAGDTHLQGEEAEAAGVPGLSLIHI